MNAFLRRFLDLWQSLARWYYGWRYGAVAKRMASPGAKVGRGFVVVQIDGLSHACLLDAVVKGYVPYIASLLRSGQAEAVRWFCGLPSTTPAVQAEIMFGTKSLVPGFRWYEKRTRQAVVCKLPGPMHVLQEQLRLHGQGILAGGASYANVFDAGAASSLFTLSAVGRSSFLQRIAGLWVFLLLLFSPARSARILLLALWTYLSVLWRRVLAYFFPSKFGRLSLLAPFWHVLADVIVREIETFSVLVDIYRGVPAIYVNYNSYDEWAHLFGQSDKYAYRMLRRIDSQIQQIDRMRRRWAGREYDLYILSDHGMADCVPFERAFGISLGQLIGSRLQWPITTDETQVGAADFRGAPVLLADEVAAVSGRLPRLLDMGAKLLRRVLLRRAEHEPSSSRRTDVVVRNSGPLSHVYFTATDAQLTAAELEAMFPGLLASLAAHPGIGLVATRHAGKLQLYTRQGGACTAKELPHGMLEALPDQEELLAELERLVLSPNSGDLVVMGRWGLWGQDGLVVSFERQRATHGGVGGEQCYPFLLCVGLPAASLSAVRTAADIRQLLLAYSAEGEEHLPGVWPGVATQPSGSSEVARRGD